MDTFSRAIRGRVRNNVVRSAVNLCDDKWSFLGTMQFRRLSGLQDSVKQPNPVTFVETLIASTSVEIFLLIPMGMVVILASTTVDITESMLQSASIGMGSCRVTCWRKAVNNVGW